MQYIFMIGCKREFLTKVFLLKTALLIAIIVIVELNREAYYENRWNLRAWTGIIWDQLTGSYILPNRLASKGYKSFLRESRSIYYKICPLTEGAKCGFTMMARFHSIPGILHPFLTKNIVNGGTQCSAELSDLNPLDPFLWEPRRSSF